LSPYSRRLRQADQGDSVSIDDILDDLSDDENLVATLSAQGLALDDPNLRRAMAQRAKDIDGELTGTRASAEEARLALQTREHRLYRETDESGLMAGVGFGILVAILFGIFAAVAAWRRWAVLGDMLSAFPQIWTRGWGPLLLWVVLLATLVMVAWSIDGLARRLPRRRNTLRESLGLDALRTAYRRAADVEKEEARKVLREHISLYLNELRSPAYVASIVTESALDVADVTGMTPDGEPGEVEGGDAPYVTRNTGLSETPRPGHEVPTAARAQIERRLQELPGASLGISGPRGVGKSTLLASICTSSREPGPSRKLAIRTAAPVEYEGREFLLHLFSSLCREVLKVEGLAPRGSLDQEILSQFQAWQQTALARYTRSIGRTLTLSGTVFAALGLLFAVAVVQLNSAVQPQAPASVAPTAESGKGNARGGRAEAPAANQTAAKPSAPKALSEALGFVPGPMLLLGLTSLGVGAIILFPRWIERQSLRACARGLPRQTAPSSGPWQSFETFSFSGAIPADGRAASARPWGSKRR